MGFPDDLYEKPDSLYEILAVYWNPDSLYGNLDSLKGNPDSLYAKPKKMLFFAAFLFFYLFLLSFLFFYLFLLSFLFFFLSFLFFFKSLAPQIINRFSYHLTPQKSSFTSAPAFFTIHVNLVTLIIRISLLN